MACQKTVDPLLAGKCGDSISGVAESLVPPTFLGKTWLLRSFDYADVDEFGYQPLDRDAANLLFRVVSYRYQRGSIAMTTNKGITSWPEVLAGDEVLAGAILDRLLHSATVLNIQGRSYRLRDMEASLGQVTPPTSGQTTEEASTTSE